MFYNITYSSAGCPQPRIKNEKMPIEKIYIRLFAIIYARLGTACATIACVIYLI